MTGSCAVEGGEAGGVEEEVGGGGSEEEGHEGLGDDVGTGDIDVPGCGEGGAGGEGGVVFCVGS